jgi:hypothetical protein
MTFEITPVGASTSGGELAQFLQFQSEGDDLGLPNVTIVNFTGEGIVATRGTGENANVITVTITPPSTEDILTLRSTFDVMTYAAVYQADFPGVVEAEGTFTAATAGTNVTLSGGDMVATFTDVGSVANTTGLNKGAVPVAYEIEITSSFSGKLQAGMWATAFSQFDGEQPHGGGSDFGIWANMDGTVEGFVSGGPLGVTLGTGDVLGIVFGGDNVNVSFYVNGTARGGVNSLGDNDPLYAMGSRNT